MKAAALLWCDIESTGLSPEKDEILEIAWVYTDATYPWHPQGYLSGFEGDYVVGLEGDLGGIALCPPAVLEMHAASGLLDAVKNGPWTDIGAVERQLLALAETFPRDEKGRSLVMLAGSSVHFDLGFLRVHMPDFARKLSYRCFDVSAVREFCYSLGMPEGERRDPAHRAMADLLASQEIGRSCVGWLRDPEAQVSVTRQLLEHTQLLLEHTQHLFVTSALDGKALRAVVDTLTRENRALAEDADRRDREYTALVLEKGAGKERK